MVVAAACVDGSDGECVLKRGERGDLGEPCLLLLLLLLLFAVSPPSLEDDADDTARRDRAGT